MPWGIVLQKNKVLTKKLETVINTAILKYLEVPNPSQFLSFTDQLTYSTCIYDSPNHDQAIAILEGILYILVEVVFSFTAVYVLFSSRPQNLEFGLIQMVNFIPFWLLVFMIHGKT